MAFYPYTPREALLAIRHRILRGGDEGGMVGELDKLAQEGLRTNLMRGGYELTDQLADRLADALRVLYDLRKGNVELDHILSDIDEVLALPPDIEAMMERRAGQRAERARGAHMGRRRR